MADIIFNSCKATFKIEGQGFEIDEQVLIPIGKLQNLTNISILEQYMKLGKKVERFYVVVEPIHDVRAVA